MRTLDIGGGKDVANLRGMDGFIRFGVDVQARHRANGLDTMPGVYRADVAWEPLPFPSNWFTRVYAHDVLEHIPKVIYTTVLAPAGQKLDLSSVTVVEDLEDTSRRVLLVRRYALLELFNEVWRVLRPGGTFELCFPTSEDRRMGDPTHTSDLHRNTINYLAPFGPENFEWSLMKGYGYNAQWLRLAEMPAHGGGHHYVELSAIKE